MNLVRDLNKLDILNLEWPNSDRDLHIVTPVLIYLNKKYNISFKTKSIFNGYYFLIKYKPKMLIISNFVGAKINHEIVKLAYSMNIKVISFISEGNVKEEALEQFLWGWNTDKILYVNKMLLWSNRSRDIFLSQYPYLKDRLITSGATGFDRYKLLNFIPKNKFLKDNNLDYNKIVGIGAWGFDHFFGDYYAKHEQQFLEIYSKEQIEMHRNDLFKVQRVYQMLIENNPDILFILRYHPGTIDFEKNEFYGLDKYKNVFISNRFQNREYQISDLINISDLWVGYETTTAMEAWLLGKQTFLINPTRSDFIRENVHKGSPIVKSAEEAQDLIDEYFKNYTIKSFEDLEDSRKRIIKDVIEYGDGQNYIRASEEVLKVYNQSDKKIRFNLKIYHEAFKQILKLILSKTILRKKWPNLYYKKDFAKPYQNMYNKVINV
jgi:surface carbohydrate biosynthesis protein